MLYKVLNEDLRDTGVSLVDPSWKAKFEIAQSMNQAMVKDNLKSICFNMVEFCYR